jgi:exosortase A
MTSQEESRLPGWKFTLTAIVLVLSWIAYWYWGTLEAMAEIWWRSETYAHGLIVPPISLWLIWRKRHRLATAQPQPTYRFAVPLACFVFCWLLGELTAVNALTQFAVVGIIVLTVMSLAGSAISKELAFPLIFLFFAVPIGDFLLPQLMEWTANFTVLALRLSAIPVFREGQNFVIPSGNWSVVEACSGIRYLIASLTVGTLYAYLTYTSLKRRLAFILVALLVPVGANWLRAYLIVLLGHISGNKLATGADHLIYGWVFFGIVIAIMFAIGMRWAEPVQSDLSYEQISTDQNQRTTNPWPIASLLAFIIAAGPLYEAYLQQANATAVIKLELPIPSSSWHSAPSPIDWQPGFANPSSELHTGYSNSESWIGLYIAYYQNQNYERKLVTSTNVLATSKDPLWQILNREPASAPLGGTEFSVRQAELLQKQSITDNRYIVWMWYWINGHLTSSDIEAKWLTAWAMMTGHGDDSAVVILYAPKATAASTLPAFANERGADILRILAEARQK